MLLPPKNPTSALGPSGLATSPLPRFFLTWQSIFVFLNMRVTNRVNGRFLKLYCPSAIEVGTAGESRVAAVERGLTIDVIVELLVVTVHSFRSAYLLFDICGAIFCALQATMCCSSRKTSRAYITPNRSQFGLVRPRRNRTTLHRSRLLQNCSPKYATGYVQCSWIGLTSILSRPSRYSSTG